MPNNPITVYSPSGASIKIEGTKETLAAAKAKGWSATKPSSKGGGPSSSPSQPKPSGSGHGVTGSWEGEMPKPGFTEGLKAGINPLHQTPENMPIQGTMGPMVKGAADTFNVREIFNRGAGGDTAGAIGQTAGTVAGLFGPDYIKAAGKGMKEASLGLRAIKEAPLIDRAMKGAKPLVQKLGGAIEVARYAERYVAPLHEALDKKFDAVHKILQGKVIAVPSSLRQLANALKKSTEEEVAKIGEELSGRTALEYEKAEAFRRTFQGMALHGSDLAQPEAKKGLAILEHELDTLAKAHNVDQPRAAYREAYKEVVALAGHVAGTAKTKEGVIKPMAKAVMGKFGANPVEAISAGGSMGSAIKIQVSKMAKARAKQLAAKLGVDARELEIKGMEGIESEAEKLGTKLQVGGNIGTGAAIVGGAARGVMSGMTPNKPQKEMQQ